jgi:tRNA dimethylallyltransferase
MVSDHSRSDDLPLLVIVGPTAVGKTALSLDLAERLDGEIVSSDSRLFYRGMDVGTAKPTPEEQARIPHHLIDIADPDETVGLAQFCCLARQAIGAIHARGRLPMLVGGTGQYVRAIVEGWNPPAVAPQPELRAELESFAEREGPYALHARLEARDPAAAARIHPHNVRRVVRALEVCIATGEPFSAQRTRTPPPYRILQIGLTMQREALYERVDWRVEVMIATGLLNEVRQLVGAGYRWELPSMSGLGYAQFRPYFEGDATLEEITTEIKHETHRFIRHQYNWFSLDNPGIQWFDVTDQNRHHEIATFVRRWLQGDDR